MRRGFSRNMLRILILPPSNFLPSFSPSLGVVASAADDADVVSGAVANLDASAVVGDDASMTGELSSSSTSLSEAAPGVMNVLRPFVMDVELK